MKILNPNPHVCIIRHLPILKKAPPIKARISFIKNLENIIDEHISDETFGILQLCKAIGLSRSQLHNKIKAQAKVSTSIFVRNIRLDRAKYLLQNSDMNVSEIAYQVGFKDPSYFSRLYSDRFGNSPSQR